VSGSSSTLKSGCGFLSLFRMLKTVFTLKSLSLNACVISEGVTSGLYSLERLEGHCYFSVDRCSRFL